MMSSIFTLFLLGHIIGDFYFQSESLAHAKNERFRATAIHSVFYLLGMLAGSVICPGAFRCILVLSALHFIIDSLKYILVRKIKRPLNLSGKRNLFVADQLLHLACLFGAALWFYRTGGRLAPSPWLAAAAGGRTVTTIVAWCTALLLIWKPANILIQRLLAMYRPANSDNGDVRSNNAGRFIGTLERIIMLILIALGQFAAIGLVLTAKSIARFEKISQEKDFAEYYLLGTLLSTLIVIVSSFLV